MICVTIRKGQDCAFMTAKGCSYNGGSCYPIVEQCDSCSRSQQFETGWYCIACPEPAKKWKNGKCNLATHLVKEAKVSSQKINPLKASKRGGK